MSKSDTTKKLRKKTYIVKFETIDVGAPMALVINVLGLGEICKRGKLNLAQADIISIKRSK